MTRNIIIAILIITAMLLLAYYYKASSLNLDAKGVTLKVKEKTAFFDSTNIKTTPIVFSNVNIMQSKLSDGTYFEVATCEPLFEFNQNTKDVINTLFEADKVEVLFSIRNLSAMRVILKNAQVINLFVDDSNMKELKLFYGIPYDTFSPVVEKLMGGKFKKFTIGGIFELPKAMTKWDAKHNNYDGIIVSTDY